VSGQISAADLVKSVPELSDYAEISAEQICNVNSDDMTDALWLKLSRRIAELEADDAVDGIVVTHGTDTMDETAFFVSMTVRCEKAVIFTGSMKPATAKNPDGPANLLGAVRVAAGFAVDDDPPAN
jgi:L-asparaginase